MACEGKGSWPELVGAKGEAAVEIIERENTAVRAIIVVIGKSVVTMDYRCDRVWVWVNDDNVVARIPQIG